MVYEKENIGILIQLMNYLTMSVMTTWMELENTMLNEICQEQIPTLSSNKNTEE